MSAPLPSPPDPRLAAVDAEVYAGVVTYADERYGGIDLAPSGELAIRFHGERRRRLALLAGEEPEAPAD